MDITQDTINELCFKKVVKQIPDEKVAMVWGCHHCPAWKKVPPAFYEQAGLPVCCGDEMYYIRTEIVK